jgi:4-hydroxybenzoate polyprenyltransferase
MKNYLHLIKFSHSIFALPFAIIGFFLGVTAPGAFRNIKINHFLLDTPLKKTEVYFQLQYGIFILVIACMIFARSAAMAFNRYLDRHIDAKNPRTKIREIPSGVIMPKHALGFTIVSALLFIVTCYFINDLCFYLSFVALFVVLGYSYTKRFTPLCHLILGLGLALAPVGAFIAVTNQFNGLPIFFSLVVFFWVSGFDVIYALQDESFDRENNLQSIPVLLGTKNALRVSRIFHTVAAGILIYIGSRYPFYYLYWIGTGFFCILLIRQHTLIKENDLRKVDLAFFTLNGFASILFAVFVIADILFLN